MSWAVFECGGAGAPRLLLAAEGFNAQDVGRALAARIGAEPGPERIILGPTTYRVEPLDGGRVLVRASGSGRGGMSDWLARRGEAILASAMDGFFVVDEDYRFIEVNEAFCRMTGYSASELRQMRISDLEVTDAGAGGMPAHTRTGLHHFPAAHRHRDGHLIYLELSVNVLYDEGRKILVGFARDVTERRRAQRELARLSRQHKLILESAAEGICGLDRRGRVVFANPAAGRLLGCWPGELIGADAHDVLGLAGAQDPGHQADCALCTALGDGGERRQIETTLRREDGSDLEIEYDVTPMRERDAEIGGVLLLRDVSQRKAAERRRRELEAQVQQAQKLESLGLLAGGIAHDFNNMLVGILGNACLALEQLDDRNAVRERLERIIGTGERASKVIRQILAYAGEASAERVPLDLSKLVGEIADFLRVGLDSHIALKTELAAGLPPIEADSGQMQQVLTNLVVNAAEAIGPRGGTVTVATRLWQAGLDPGACGFSGTPRRAPAYVVLEVRDDGCGMDAATLARIFDPFFSSKGTGRGLGLAAIHGIVRAHGGAIRVQSQPGSGTTFTLLLPAIRARMPQRPAPRRAGLKRGTCVLVVDDEPEVREVVRAILEQRGARVLAAANGPEAIELFSAQADQIDVVLLDLTMPGMSGAEVYEQLVRIRPDVRVVVSSGYGEREIAQRIGDRAPAGFVRKPFTSASLVARIGEVIGAEGAQGAAGQASTPSGREGG